MHRTSIASFQEHPRQDEVLAFQSRFKVIVAGRRFGKGNLALREVANDAVRNPDSDYWIVSPNYSYTQPMWDKAIMAFSKVKIGSAPFMKKPRIKDKQLPLFNGSKIEFKSSIEPHTLRGAGDRMRGIIFDEAAYCDREAWKAVRPALIDNRAWGVFISTPNADTPKNWFYDLYLRGQTHIKSTCEHCFGGGCEMCGHNGHTMVENASKMPSYTSWQFSSFDNPHIEAAEIETMIAEEGWGEIDILREVYGEFIGGQSIVFNFDAIQDCSRGKAERHDPRFRYVTGIDLGRVGSYTVITTIKLPNSENEVPHVVRIDRFRGPWPLQKARIVEHVKHFGQSWVYIDATGLGDTMRDDLIAMGLRHIVPIKLSGPTKTQICEALIAAVDGASLTWYPNQQLEKEMLNFEAVVSTTGNVQYRKPKGPGQFDDSVISMALAWWAYLKIGGPNRGRVWVAGIGQRQA